MLLGWTQRHPQQADLKLSKKKSLAVEQQPLFENGCTPGMWQLLQSTLKYIHPVSFHTQDGQLRTNLIKPKKKTRFFCEIQVHWVSKIPLALPRRLLLQSL